MTDQELKNSVVSVIRDVMQKIEVVDFGRTTEDFRRVAKEQVEILYEQ